MREVSSPQIFCRGQRRFYGFVKSMESLLSAKKLQSQPCKKLMKPLILKTLTQKDKRERE